MITFIKIILSQNFFFTKKLLIYEQLRTSRHLYLTIIINTLVIFSEICHKFSYFFLMIFNEK
jgi:hypothetical protein